MNDSKNTKQKCQHSRWSYQPLLTTHCTSLLHIDGISQAMAASACAGPPASSLVLLHVVVELHCKLQQEASVTRIKRPSQHLNYGPISSRVCIIRKPTRVTRHISTTATLMDSAKSDQRATLNTLTLLSSAQDASFKPVPCESSSQSHDTAAGAHRSLFTAAACCCHTSLHQSCRHTTCPRCADSAPGPTGQQSCICSCHTCTRPSSKPTANR